MCLLPADVRKQLDRIARHFTRAEINSIVNIRIEKNNNKKYKQNKTTKAEVN